MSGLKNHLIAEIQKLSAHLQNEIENARRFTNEVDVRKVDKKELLEFRQAIQNGLGSKPELTEIQSVLNKFTSEQTQKAFELRQELFKKITEIQGLVSVSVGNKVSVEDFNEAIS